MNYVVGIAIAEKEPVFVRILNTNSALNLDAEFTGSVKKAVKVKYQKK